MGLMRLSRHPACCAIPVLPCVPGGAGTEGPDPQVAFCSRQVCSCRRLLCPSMEATAVSCLGAWLPCQMSTSQAVAQPKPALCRQTCPGACGGQSISGSRGGPSLRRGSSMSLARGTSTSGRPPGRGTVGARVSQQACCVPIVCVASLAVRSDRDPEHWPAQASST